MSVSITLEGSDLKVAESNEINYYPVTDVSQRVLGTKVELYLDGDLVKSFDETEFTTPSGTSEQVGDGISQLAPAGGGGGDASAANQVLGIAQLTTQTALLAKSDYSKLTNEADDLVQTYTWLDGGGADQRISTIVYSSTSLSLSVTKTFTYSGSAGTYHIATLTLS